MTEIIKAQDFVETIKEKVKQEFIKAVPEEKWNAFIQETIEQYKNNDLKKVIIDELKEQSKEVVRVYMKEKSINSYDAKRQRDTLDQATREMIVANAPQMLAEVFDQIAQRVFYAMANNKY